MATYLDTPLKQVIADLNFKNAATVLTPLLESQCTLSNPVADSSRGDGTNTRATLTVTQANPNYAGTMTVYYKRLDLATLYAGAPTEKIYEGAPSQATTKHALLQSLTPWVDENPLVFDLVSNIIADDPVAIELTPSDVVFAAPAGHLQFIGQYTVSVKTQQIDVSTFSADMTPHFFTDTELLATGTDFDQTVVDKILAANNRSAVPLNKSNVSLVYGADGPTGTSTRTVTMTVTDAENAYTGSKVFTYRMVSAKLAFPDVITTILTDERDMKTVLENAFVAAGYLKPNLPYMGITDSEMSTTLAVFSPVIRDRYWYNRLPAQGSRAVFSVQEATVTPFEVIFDLTVAADAVLTFWNGTLTNGPTKVELLSAPGGMPAEVNLSTAGVTAQTMLAGNYTVRLTAPNARLITNGVNKDQVSFRTTLGITRVRKVKATSAYQMFTNHTTITTIDASVFSEATRLWRCAFMFSGCSGITSVAAGLFDNLLSCKEFNSMFSNTNITTVPTHLFANLPAIYGARRTATTFAVSSASSFTLPSGCFHNLSGFSFENVFVGTKATAVPADLFTGSISIMPEPHMESSLSNKEAHILSNLFSNSQIATLPAALLDVFRNNGPTLLSSVFSNTKITAIPSGLFANISAAIGLSGGSGPAQFYQTFASCSLLTSIPADLFDNVTGGVTGLYQTFLSSAVNTIPAGLFANTPNIERIEQAFGSTQVPSIPAGLFAGLSQLKSVRNVFRACTALQAIPSALFNNLPALTDTNSAFSTCSNVNLTSVPADLFAGTTTNVEDAASMFEGTKLTTAPAGLFNNVRSKIKTLTNLFSGCTALTTIPAGFFENMTLLQSANGMFLSCTALTTLPTNMFAGCPAITNFSGLFNGATTLATIPSGMFTGCTQVTNIAQIFRNTNITAIPAGIFDAMTALTTVNNAFESGKMTSVPNGLFYNSPLISNASGLFAQSLVNVAPVDLFAVSNTPINLQGLFSLGRLTSLPDGWLHNLGCITDISAAFTYVPLVTVGKIIHNKVATTMAVGSMFGFGQGTTQDIAFADNFIDSDVILTLTNSNSPGSGIMGGNWRPDINVTNWLGANIRIANKFFLSSMQYLSGSGLDFIAKHQLATPANNGVFYSAIGLSDTASLPAWATASS